jgi:hypothetical protein
MDDSSSTTATLDQADEDILTYEVSDEALEAAAGTDRGGYSFYTFGGTGGCAGERKPQECGL